MIMFLPSIELELRYEHLEKVNVNTLKSFFVTKVD